MALVRRSPPREMLLHSDQGSPYTATGYLARLADLGMVVSMSRSGNCYDNAAMESFFSTLKGECVQRCTFETRQEARQTIFEYIECFYNRVRRHSTLSYLSPVAYEQQRHSSPSFVPPKKSGQTTLDEYTDLQSAPFLQ
jgi:putative transposase